MRTVHACFAMLFGISIGSAQTLISHATGSSTYHAGAGEDGKAMQHTVKLILQK